jgi:hypothetical protein
MSEEVERAPHCSVDQVVDRLRPHVEARHRRADDHPSNDAS